MRKIWQYYTIGKVCAQAKWHIQLQLILVSITWSNWEYCYYPLDGMSEYYKVIPSISSSILDNLLNFWMREKMWKQGGFPKNQTQQPGQVSNPGLTDQESRAATIRPLHLPHCMVKQCKNTVKSKAIKWPWWLVFFSKKIWSASDFFVATRNTLCCFCLLYTLYKVDVMLKLGQ